MEYFFGNKDIRVSQELAKRGFYGKLNGLLIVTGEKEIPLSTVYDYDAIKQVEKEHPEAIGLIKNLKNAFTQKDKNKNLIKPSFVYFVGIKEVGDEISFNKLEEVLESKTRFIYGISFVKYTKKINAWAVTYPKNVMFFFSKNTDEDFLETEKSEKIRIFFDEEDEGKHTMEATKLLWSKKLEGTKFQELVGATPANLKDGIVIELDNKGLVAYRTVNQSGEVTNSLMSNGKTHIDTVFIMDSIKYLLANNMHKMFKENNVDSSNVRELVQIYSKKALDYAFEELRMIEKNEDYTPKYSIQIPQITGRIRETRDLTGVKWKFIPNIPIESIEGTAVEVLDEIELNINDLEGAN